MDIEKLKKQIEIYKQDNTLTDNIKSIRISIINTAIQRIEGYQLYTQTLYQFLQSGNELVELTDDLYQIEKTLELNRISIKGMILDSNLCKWLDQAGIKYTLTDLRKYLNEQYNNENIDVEVINKEINLYETIDNLIRFENNQIDQMASLIGNIINDNVLLKRIKNKNIIHENKSNVVNKISNLLKDEVLDLFTHKLLENMVSQIFNNYLGTDNDVINNMLNN